MKLTPSFEMSRMASEAAEAALRAVSSGQEADSSSLHDQPMGAKREASEAETRVLQADLERQHAKRRLRMLQAELREAAARHRRDQALIESHQAQIDIIQAQMSRMEDEARRTALHRVGALRRAVRAHRGVAARLAARLRRYDYSCPPPPGLNPRRILGPVWKLFDVPDTTFCKGLEMIAQKKLYSVVVDKEKTRRFLLRHGNLRSRTTLIALDRVRTRVLGPPLVAVAQEIGVLERLLERRTALAATEEKLAQAKAELAEAEAVLAGDSATLVANKKLYGALKNQYEKMARELKVVKSRMAASSYARRRGEIKTLRKQISKLKEASGRDKAAQKKASARANDLEAKVKDIRAHRKREYKKVEQEGEETAAAADQLQQHDLASHTSHSESGGGGKRKRQTACQNTYWLRSHLPRQPVIDDNETN